MSELNDLPNIGASLQEKLHRIGVENLEDLMTLGSVEAVVRIGGPSGAGCYNMLYALEGAIRGVRWHSLPGEVKKKLKHDLDAKED